MTNRRVRHVIARLSLTLWALTALTAQPFDVVVYGGTAGGVTAAVAAAREGVRVQLVEPGRFLGGLTAGGQSAADAPLQDAVGGLALEFYQRVGKHYGETVAWRFEPYVASLVFREMLRETSVDVVTEERLREERAVRRNKGRIGRVIAESGSVFEAAVFIDATYEGDLMAVAEVSYAAGQPPVLNIHELGFSFCLTGSTINRLPYPQPEGYNAEVFAAAAGGSPEWQDWFAATDLPGGKQAVAIRNGVSGIPSARGWDYCEADYRRRALILQERFNATAGLLYFLANDSRAPAGVRSWLRERGFCADEFSYNNNWPYQVRISEARRLVGEVTLTPEGSPPGESAIGVAGGDPAFLIPYGVMVPQASEIENLLVVSCPSAEGAAWAALRGETESMILGQAAGVAAAMAIRSGTSVQQVPAAELAERLRSKRAILSLP